MQPFSPNLVVFAGKKNVIGEMDQDRFAGGNATEQFVNLALIANPAFLSAMPYTSFVVGAVSPQKWGSMSLYLRDPENRTRDTVGLSDLYAKGVLLGGEVRLKTNFFGLPGDQHVGGIWKHLDQTNLNFLLSPQPQFPEERSPGSRTLSDGYTVYYGFDQFVVRYSSEEERGWGFFGRASISDGNPTPVRYFISTGIGGDSPFRQGDKFGVGWYYIGVSDEVGPIGRAVFAPRNGTGVELFYNAQVLPWLTITPDFQYIKPGFGAIADDAYVFGLRANMSL